MYGGSSLPRDRGISVKQLRTSRCLTRSIGFSSFSQHPEPSSCYATLPSVPSSPPFITLPNEPTTTMSSHNGHKEVAQGTVTRYQQILETIYETSEEVCTSQLPLL
jgi:hypothetical protein